MQTQKNQSNGTINRKDKDKSDTLPVLIYITFMLVCLGAIVFITAEFLLK